MKYTLIILIFVAFTVTTFGQTNSKKPDSEAVNELTYCDQKRAKYMKEEVKESLKKDWVIYKEDKCSGELYYPRTLVKKGNLIKVWTKNFYVLFDKSWYYMMRLEINCEEYEYRILESIYYEEYILSSESNKLALNKRPIIPESSEQELESKVCKLAK